MTEKIKHETHHYIDSEGKYIGGFGDGATPPEGAILVPNGPKHGLDRWDFDAQAFIEEDHRYLEERFADDFRDKLKENFENLNSLDTSLELIQFESSMVTPIFKNFTDKNQQKLILIKAIQGFQVTDAQDNLLVQSLKQNFLDSLQ